jgi:tellurite resistance protein TerC
MELKTGFWIIFNVFILFMLFLDLKVFNRKDHEVKMKEALLWSAMWIVLALLFNLGLYFFYEPQSGVTRTDAALQFLTGYLIEKSLSVDNLFVFVLIFKYFRVPAMYQHKVLFWGILGALIMRGIFIFAGIALINQFAFIIYIFGAFLIYTGIKIAFEQEKEIQPNNNPIYKFVKHKLRLTDHNEEGKFTIRRNGKLFFTPLFLVLIVVETTDLIFAVDSIPAILAITQDPFIVYSSNVFAILGLRALYFALASMITLFHYLNYGLAFILTFVGAKMIVNHYFGGKVIANEVSLGVILLSLAVSIIVSILKPKKEAEELEETVKKTAKEK